MPSSRNVQFEDSRVKLYFSPASGSLAARIVLTEAGLPCEFVRVSLKTRTTADGADYLAINPKGYVPCLQLDNGEIYTENTALLPYLGSLKPAAGLMPADGTTANYRVREWLGFISTELHKNCSPLFRRGAAEETVAFTRELLGRRLAYVDKALAGRAFLTGDGFTVADAYLYVVTTWFRTLNIDLAAYPNLQAFNQRVAARPAVQQALAEESPPK